MQGSPNNRSDKWRELGKRVYMPVVNRVDPVLVRARGADVWDEDGKHYLDFTAGWAVLNVGHSHPKVVEAISKQAAQLIQVTHRYHTIPQLELAELIVDNSCFDKVFFCNSGAEANEGAVKVARKWGKTELDGAFKVITATNSFHGRTLAMVAATGQPAHHQKWQPLPPGFEHVPYGDMDALRAATDSKTCAVLLEPVQGEGGVNIPDPNYLYEVQEWCRSHNILFMLDEVQTGMGRLGTLFGYQSFEAVEPDVMTLGKAVGGGTPLGAFATRDYCSVLEPGDHGTTFGGNALSTAAGLASLRIILEDNLPQAAKDKGALLNEGLLNLIEHHKVLKSTRGMGLLRALEFTQDHAAKIVNDCMNMEDGLLINAVRPNVIRFMPPLTISEQQIKTALAKIDQALTKNFG